MRRAGLALALIGALGGVRYAAVRDQPPVVDRSTVEWRQREAAIARARVFVADPGPRSIATRTREPFPARQPLECTYVPKPISGTTPKFDCRLSSGEVVKVKYGANPEVPAEVAATRLLTSLGFAADHVEHVAEVACLGCPPHPFRTRQLAEMLFLAGPLERSLNYGRMRTFDHVAVERKFDAEPITAGEVSGWQWSDLDRVDSSQGGAGRAELDALRLIAVLLAHWDNKPSNQRLVCLDARRGDDTTDGDTGAPSECQRPLLMLQDLGATFGPKKLNHRNWARTPIWESPDGCVATMASLPYNGATFQRRAISEEGRALLVARLSRLADAEMHALFREAAFPDAVSGDARAADVSPWVRTLQQKIREIADHPPCVSPA